MYHHHHHHCDREKIPVGAVVETLRCKNGPVGQSDNWDDPELTKKQIIYQLGKA